MTAALLFDELDAAAKRRAREEFTKEGYLDYEWWDSCLEDALYIWRLFGFTVERRHAWFSGFSSQGDGASFAGDYRAPEGTVSAALVDHAPKDQALHALAYRIDSLQTKARLLWGTTWSCKVSRTSNAVHSHSMHISALWTTSGEIPEDFDLQPVKDELLAIARALADWWYRQLDGEHDYLYSDEVVDSILRDRKFDQLGCMI